MLSCDAPTAHPHRLGTFGGRYAMAASSLEGLPLGELLAVLRESLLRHGYREADLLPSAARTSRSARGSEQIRESGITSPASEPETSGGDRRAADRHKPEPHE